MPTVDLEGVGATIEFATSGFEAAVVSLTLPEQSREALDNTHLGTVVAKTSKPGKLKKVGQVTCEFDHDPTAPKLIGAEPEEITITYPAQEGEETGAQIVFTGYAVSEGGEEFKVDTLMRTKLTFEVSGDFEYVDAVPEASA